MFIFSIHTLLNLSKQPSSPNKTQAFNRYSQQESMPAPTPESLRTQSPEEKKTFLRLFSNNLLVKMNQALSIWPTMHTERKIKEFKQLVTHDSQPMMKQKMTSLATCAYLSSHQYHPFPLHYFYNVQPTYSSSIFGSKGELSRSSSITSIQKKEDS